MNEYSTSTLCLTYQKVKAKLIEFNVDKTQYPRFQIESTELSYFSVYLLSRYAEEYFKDPESDDTKRIYNELTIASQYFDMCEKSKANVNYNWDFLLSASCAYFLSDNFGSSKVIINKVCVRDLPNDHCRAIYYILTFIFFERRDWNQKFTFAEILDSLLKYLIGEQDEKVVYALIARFNYSPNEMMSSFYKDIFYAIVRKIIECSSIKLLPELSSIDRNLWRHEIRKEHFPKILWQAQRLIGQKGVFSGKSCIVQLPTGVGKTKSIELIIKSAFLSGRASVVIIVAPLRALCNEILNDMEKSFSNEAKINKISDAIQEDFVMNFDVNLKNIIICTPEKLNYLFIHDPDSLRLVDLFIFDEGHLFDDDNRGTEYELLLTKIINSTANVSQKILISAVISNARDLSNWLTNSNDNFVNDSEIKTTMKSFSFLSKNNYTLYFFDKNFDRYSCFIPNLLSDIKLEKIGRERKQRIFPTNAMQNSLYLADKLCRQGVVAIYINQARTIHTLYKELSIVVQHGLTLNNLIEANNSSEVMKMLRLISLHYGEISDVYFLASQGIFPHYSNLENGIKISTEFAVKNGLLNTIVCTSTLTQGVNLPIKYLILSTLNENRFVMTNRSFQNLIGRTARSGMHTEGTIIISETEYYDNRLNRKNHKFYLWKELAGKLNRENNEKCSSTILKLVEDFNLDYGFTIKNREIYDYLCDNYLDDMVYENLTKLLIDKYGTKKQVLIEELINKIKFVVEKIENYLINQLDNEEDLSAESICERTYGYAIGTSEEKQKLLNLFDVISKKITSYPSKEMLIRFATAMTDINKGEVIYDWFLSNKNLLRTNMNEFLKNIETIFTEVCDFKGKEYFSDTIDMWINNMSYYEIAEEIQENDIHKVEKLCNKIISYEYSFFIGSLIDICKEEIIIDELNYLKMYQKMIKYGLSNRIEIEIYECGLADRAIAHLISRYFNNNPLANIKQKFIAHQTEILEITNEYPSIFSNIVNKIIEN